MAFVDFHTGLGPFGHGEIMTNTAPGTPEYKRALGWWGARVKATWDGGAVGAELAGPMKTALSADLPRAEVTAVSLEFGTYAASRVLRAMQGENWLHHHGGPAHPRAARIKARMRRAFYPDTDDWKLRVWRQAVEGVEQALAGLTARGI